MLVSLLYSNFIITKISIKEPINAYRMIKENANNKNNEKRKVKHRKGAYHGKQATCVISWRDDTNAIFAGEEINRGRSS